MANPLRARPLDWLARSPIGNVGQDGQVYLSPDAIRQLTDLFTKVDTTLSVKGEIRKEANVTGRTENLQTTVGQIDSGGVLLAAGADFTRAYLNKNLDNVPNGMRCAWDTTTQKGAAVDANGNLLLKNIASAVGVTSGPTTSSATFADLPEMTLTFTTKGNKILIVFAGVFDNSTSLTTDLELILLRDGVQQFVTTHVGFLNGTDYFQNGTLVFLDQPAAGSHTYKIQWASALSTQVTATTQARILQATELG